MSLIDPTYFVGDIHIPNIRNAGITQDEFLLDLDIWEDEILADLLGYELYTEFMTELDSGSPAQKFTDLRDGAEFTFNYNGRDITTKWIGLANDEKVSLIAYYAYFKWKEKTATLTTEFGEKTANVQNAQLASDRQKAVNAYNKMINLYGESLPYFDKYSTYQVVSDLPSAYNFLLAGDYDNWLYEPKYKINAFDL